MKNYFLNTETQEIVCVLAPKVESATEKNLVAYVVTYDAKGNFVSTKDSQPKVCTLGEFSRLDVDGRRIMVPVEVEVKVKVSRVHHLNPEDLDIDTVTWMRNGETDFLTQQISKIRNQVTELKKELKND